MRADVHIADIVSGLERHNLLPAILFRTARSQCDTDIQRASRIRHLELPADKQREIWLCVKSLIARYEMEEELITSHPQYSALLKTGIGAHHAGQLLMWRLLLEELMSLGLLRVLVATGTVAAGVDFPARTVVITAHSKRGAEGFKSLSAAEFQQMSGRAGRRGKDTVGFCLAAPAPFCDARALLKLAKLPSEPLRSSYFPSPSTVLSLLRYRNVDDLRYTVARSFKAYVDRQAAISLRKESEKVLEELTEETSKKAVKGARRLQRKADEYENRQLQLLDISLEGLRQLGYLNGDSLSEKGYWAALLCTSIVLELAEIIETGLLTDISVEKLVAILSAISADEHRQYLKVENKFFSKDEINQISSIIEKISAYQMPGVMENRKVVPAAADTVLVWLKSENWQEFRSLLQLSGVAEGDAARLITQTADHLNQLTRLNETHPELALRAEEAKRRILRPPLTEVINLEIV